MTDNTTTSALDGLRWLAGQIDRAVEDLMAAHGFDFVRMAATTEEATAAFELESNWSLVFSKPVAGRATVRLERRHGAAACLAIEVGTDGARSLGEAAGLAMSFVAAHERLLARD